MGGGPHCPGATAGAIAGGLPLFVDGGEHERDVRGQQVVHLVAQAGLAQQSTTPYQTADGHVEVPLLQLEIFVNGCISRISWKRGNRGRIKCGRT